MLFPVGKAAYYDTDSVVGNTNCEEANAANSQIKEGA
jgi:hypothetical protein